MRKSFWVGVGVAAAVSLTAMSSTAVAAEYTRAISFGDSLSDNGNAFATSGSPPLPYNRRFTNKLVWIEYMAGSMQGFLSTTAINSGSVNYAFGGARTDSLPNSNGPIPGTDAQIATYLARGGTFGAKDVVTLWGGANNLFQGLPVAAANPATATAVMTGFANASAGNIGTQVGTLTGAGAKTILVFNLPDLGRTPQFSADPNASPLASFSTTAFNTALAAQLDSRAKATPGSNIVTIDMYAAFARIIQNPAAFGLSNVTSQCLTTPACVSSATEPDKYMFWDGVHPTAAGHQLVAKVATQYLYTPTLSRGVGLMSELPYVVRREATSEVADMLRGFEGEVGKGYVFAGVTGGSGKRVVTIPHQSTIGGPVKAFDEVAYDYNAYGIRAGAIQTLTPSLVGVLAFGASQGEAEATMVRTKPLTLAADVALDWRPGNHMFVTVSGGVGVTNFSDYARSTTLAPIVQTMRSVDTLSYSAQLQAGRDYHMGDWHLSPMVRVTYASATMQGFTEVGDLAHVAFEDRKVAAWTGGVSLIAARKVGDHSHLHALIGYDATISDASDDLVGKLVNNSAKAFHEDLGPVPDPGLIVGLGYDTKIAGFKVVAEYRGRFGTEEEKDHAAMLTVKKPF